MEEPCEQIEIRGQGLHTHHGHGHAHHGHGHAHHGHAHPTGTILKWSLVATVIFVVVQFTAGLHAHSLALLSDAGHNLTDALALMLAWLGYYFASKPADAQKTYGYQRTGVLAAFLNAIFLILLSLYLFWESYLRFFNPEPVQEMIMIWVASLGLILNVAIMWGLHSQKGSDLNIRSAWVHMLGDALGSVAIIIGAITIRYTGINRIDPVLSFFIAALIIWTAWDISKESLNILLEGIPRGMSLEQVRAAIVGVEGVVDVHDLHVWSLGSHSHALSCHIVIPDMQVSAAGQMLERINEVLEQRFEIDHTTVQIEYESCARAGETCSIPVRSQPHPHHH
jgi:cobalt-zinc-cadmium efflux system protein